MLDKLFELVKSVTKMVKGCLITKSSPGCSMRLKRLTVKYEKCGNLSIYNNGTVLN